MTSLDTTAIAIIGMAGRFPGARDVQTFWQNVVGGVKSVRPLSEEEMLVAGVEPEMLRQPGYVKKGATLDDIDQFDAAFFGFAPRDAETMDPQHRIFLECAWEALEDAAYDPARYRGLIGVFAGSGFSTYLLNNLYQNPEVEDIADPLLSAVGNERDALASTVSYKFNLKGPSVSVHTFCSTSLVAVHLACQSLLNYECDMALTGGAAIQVPHTAGYLYKEGGIVSPDGECRAFDAKAQGSVVGNGVGVVTLKRFSEALEDGDHIYAVILGSAVNNDGSTRVSYTAPGLEGQSAVIAEALGTAGVEVESISYIEAHGTGTVLGDSVELAAMKKAFALGTDKQQFCAIGSVKPNVGHLDRASGITGLIKTTLALNTKLLPPNINFERANPEVELEQSPFYVNTQLRVWETPENTPRRAGVSSFGLGGTNAHVVLEETPVREPSRKTRPWQLVLLSAKTESALEMATRRLHAYLQQEDINLADLAYTLQVGRGVFNHRRFLVCRDRSEVLQSLQKPSVLTTHHQTRHNRTMAFVFEGIGEQHEKMAQEFYEVEPAFREIVDECCEWLKIQQKLDLHTLLCSSNEQKESQGRRRTSNNQGRSGSTALSLHNFDPASPQTGGALLDTALAEPAIFVFEYALARLLMTWGIEPQAMLGYGLGEYVAACLAGVLTLQDALKLVAQRAQLIAAQPQGAMLSVALSEESVQPYLDEQISLSAINGENLCVLSGATEAIEAMEEYFSQQGITCQRIATNHAFHSKMLEPLNAQMRELTRGISFSSPTIPYTSTLTGKWITDEQATDPEYWVQQMCQTVRFADAAELLLQDTEHLIVAIGPGQANGALIQRNAAYTENRLFFTTPDSYERTARYAYLLQTLGSLWLEGIAPDWSGFYTHERRYRLSLPTYPFERKRYWVNQPRRQLVSARSQEHASKGKNPDKTQWFYQPVWEKSPLSAQSSTTLRGPWLLFEDQSKRGEKVAHHLKTRGESVVRVQYGQRFSQDAPDLFTIRPCEQSDYVTLCKVLESQKLLPGTILHLWNVTGDDTDTGSAAAFQDLQNYGLYSLIFLTQALGTQIYSEPIRLLVISNGLQDVTGQERLTQEKATLLGACKVIPQEYLHITCHSIDVDEDTLRDTTSFVDALFAEQTDYVVAYRQGERWRLTYQPLALPPLKEKQAVLVLRRRGTYLITGGLGGVGLVLATYLARTVQARIALLSHSAFPRRDEWGDWLVTHDTQDGTRRRIEQIQSIENLGGQILILRADVAQSEQLQAAIEQLEQEFGTLHGVIHAAGVSAKEAFRTIQEIGREQCEMHFQPKVYGLYALERALQDKQLDFCLLFSSLSSVLGGLGFVGYTAANIFIDAFVKQHNRTATSSWNCVNWDSWLVKEDMHGDLGATVAAYAMLPEEGAEAFLQVIAQRGFEQLVNSTGNLEARINQWVQLEDVQAAKNLEPGKGVARPYLSTSYVAPGDEYEQRVVEIWQQILGIEQIGVQDNFFELGGHSLMGTQLVSRLRKFFQLEIPLGTLFASPTISELTMAIKLLLLEEIEKLDEKEVMQHLL